MLIVSFNVIAEKIYERTDSQGVTEFSDKPSPDSEVIEVKPNVVDVVPPEPLTPRPSPVSPERGRVTGEAVEESSSGSVYHDDDELRERRRKRQIINENRKKAGSTFSTVVRKGLGDTIDNFLL